MIDKDGTKFLLISFSSTAEEKLINDGYLKVIGKPYEWAYNWFFERNNLKILQIVFLQNIKKAMEYTF